jgi:hypothetical protein
MARRRKGVDAAVASRLDTTPGPGSPNRISARQLRGWAVEYLRDRDDELANCPELAGQPHWNLWMVDARYQDALFAVLLFSADGVEFFCGTGNAFEIRGFAEGHLFEDPGDVRAAMAGRFSIPGGSVRLDRYAAQEWLGRDW